MINKINWHIQVMHFSLYSIKHTEYQLLCQECSFYLFECWYIYFVIIIWLNMKKFLLCYYFHKSLIYLINYITVLILIDIHNYMKSITIYFSDTPPFLICMYLLYFSIFSTLTKIPGKKALYPCPDAHYQPSAVQFPLVIILRKTWHFMQL